MAASEPWKGGVSAISAPTHLTRTQNPIRLMDAHCLHCLKVIKQQIWVPHLGK